MLVCNSAVLIQVLIRNSTLFNVWFSQWQVDPDVFAALPKELQEELKSAYNRGTHNQAQAKIGVYMLR